MLFQFPNDRARANARAALYELRQQTRASREAYAAFATLAEREAYRSQERGR